MAHILVIDDEQAITSALRQILERTGHQVSVAANGKVGMDLYAAYPVDLIITDILMPEKDGVEIVMQLRKRSSTVKILAMSGGGRHGLTDLLHVAKKLGADGIIYKPFTTQQILEEVHRLLTN
jgi:DNA-binding response OmpR family regulator